VSAKILEEILQNLLHLDGDPVAKRSRQPQQMAVTLEQSEPVKSISNRNLAPSATRQANG
jgi:hypothetical protein